MSRVLARVELTALVIKNTVASNRFYSEPAKKPSRTCFYVRKCFVCGVQGLTLVVDVAAAATGVRGRYKPPTNVLTAYTGDGSELQIKNGYQFYAPNRSNRPARCVSAEHRQCVNIVILICISMHTDS